jgi:hypothetical protein
VTRYKGRDASVAYRDDRQSNPGAGQSNETDLGMYGGRCDERNCGSRDHARGNACGARARLRLFARPVAAAQLLKEYAGQRRIGDRDCGK